MMGKFNDLRNAVNVTDIIGTMIYANSYFFLHRLNLIILALMLPGIYNLLIFNIVSYIYYSRYFIFR
jgi:hypothetical protein